MERVPLGVGGTISTDILPFDKALIKEAIVDVATHPGATDAYVDFLKTGFLLLSTFQPGGGKPSVVWQTKSDNLPRTRHELATYFSKVDGNAEVALSAASAKESSLLVQEWDIRVNTAKAMKNA